MSSDFTTRHAAAFKGLDDVFPVHAPFKHICVSDAITNEVSDPPILWRMKTIGERIAERRKELGLTQAALAKLAGMSQSAIGNLEAGLREKPRNITTLAAALRMTAEELDGEVVSREPDEVVRLRAALAKGMTPELLAVLRSILDAAEK